jgi:hypothetical protein
MNNDLISREALKKEFCKDIMGGLNWERIIDNAPTINPLTDPLFDAYSKIADLEFEHSGDFWITTPKGKKIYFEKKRPRGKWIIEHDWVHCFLCGHEQNYTSNFCPNCGADMREESDE